VGDDAADLAEEVGGAVVGRRGHPVVEAVAVDVAHAAEMMSL
jgi:hypothetical protein